MNLQNHVIGTKRLFWSEFVLNAVSQGGISKEEIKRSLAELQPTILVWNRDVSAVIAIERLHAMGIKAAVLATSADLEPDAKSFFVQFADEPIDIGTLDYKDYEAIGKLIPKHVIAVLPMWGFVSEITGLEEFCNQNGLIWIGQSDAVLDLLGNKASASVLALEAGLPLPPGSNGEVKTVDDAINIANEVGYPVRLKASLGGGGRGQEKCESDQDIREKFSDLKKSALRTFGSESLILEKNLVDTMHGEVQIVADKFGNVVAVKYRICSVQVNGQKVIEWGKHPFIENHPDIKDSLYTNAEKIVREAGLSGIATVEFHILYDDIAGEWCVKFMEVNTRIQVEHRATEIQAGINLVEWMIITAFGGKVDFERSDLKPRGDFSVNIRCVAMNPQKDFEKHGGHVMAHHAPANSRDVWVASAIRTGNIWKIKNDPMFAMVTLVADDWKELHEKAAEIMENYKVYGFPTSIPFVIKILKHPTVLNGDPVLTNFVKKHIGDLTDYVEEDSEAIRIARNILDTSATGNNPLVPNQYRGFDSPRIDVPQMPIPPVESHRSYPQLNDVGTDGYVRYIRENAVAKRPSIELVIRDASQSEHQNFLSPYAIQLMAPLLQHTNVAIIEAWGGATPQQSIRLHSFDPFELAKLWRESVPNVPLSFLSRSTNVVALVPQSPETIKEVANAIVPFMDASRDFDAVSPNNLRYSRAAYLKHHKRHIHMPCLTLSRPDKNHTIKGYVKEAVEIMRACAKIIGVKFEEVFDWVILDLKDMSGNWKPFEVSELVKALIKRMPQLVTKYHTHMNSGEWYGTTLAAVEAGAQIIGVGLECMTRNFGPPPCLTVINNLKDKGYNPIINEEVIGKINSFMQINFSLYDKFFAPQILGPKYSVRDSRLAGGAQSSLSKDLKKLSISHFQNNVEQYLKRMVEIVVAGSVTPIQQMYSTQAASCIFNAQEKHEKLEDKVRAIQVELANMDLILEGREAEVSDNAKKRLFNPNETFKKFLRGGWGKPRAGWPADWVYKAVFGEEWQNEVKNRTDLAPEVKDTPEDEVMAELIENDIHATETNILLFRMFGTDFIKSQKNAAQYGNPFLTLPDEVSLQGLQEGGSVKFTTSDGTEHSFKMLSTPAIRPDGTRVVQGMLNNVLLQRVVVVKDLRNIEKAEEGNPLHITYNQPGDIEKIFVKAGDVISPGTTVVNLNICKTDNLIPYTGEKNVKVKRIVCDAGQDVSSGELFVELEAI